MNLNELFFFKTIICNKKEKHDLDICYFCHHVNKDQRRLFLDFNSYFKKPEHYNLEGGQMCDKRLLKFYSNEIGYENDQVNEILFRNNSPCKNACEFKYHIINFKQSECYFENSGYKCEYGKLCAGVHKNNAPVDKENLEYFKAFFEKLLDVSRAMSKDEVLEVYNKIYCSDNNFTNTKIFLPKIEKNKVKIGSPMAKRDDQTKSKIIYENSSISITKPEKSILPPSHFSMNILDEFLKNNQKQQKGQSLIKMSIFNELKNIPILARGNLYSNLIYTDNQIVFISNSIPKKDELNKLVIAMLNSHSGVIIYGADINSSKLVGIKMDRKARDLFKQCFNTEYKNYLVEYEGCIKYKFYDLEDNNLKKGNSKIENLCAIVIKVKKIKDNKLLFDPYNKAYTIKEKFMKTFKQSKDEKITMTNIKQLNMKEYVEITRDKLLSYYKEKFSLK